ncbi:MAG: hypothetical protein HC913_05040 [Microscillaceae bacterium]|nr:hypothetical protein [Microscillaceae bacterium]
MEQLIRSTDLAIDFLQTDQIIRYEQVLFLYHQQQRDQDKNLLDSYKIYLKALRSIEHHLKSAGYSYELGVNSRGTFWRVSYDVYTILNKEQKAAVQVVHAANCEEFETDTVCIYCETKQSLPYDLIEMYRHWG